MVGIKADIRLNKKVVERLEVLAYRKGVTIGYSSEKEHESGPGLAEVARIQEFGTKTIPPRPFIRPTLDSFKKIWAERVVKGLKNKKTDRGVVRVWENVGKSIVRQLRSAIDKVHNPPLSAKTIERRRKNGNGSIKPLVDTGVMRDELAYQVAGEEWKK